MGIFNVFGKVNTISADEARKRLDAAQNNDITLIDVREPMEYAQGHLPGAVLMPLSQLPQRMEEIDTSRPVIVYCRSGKRSRSAASMFEALGLPSVESIEGGIGAWNGIVATGHLKDGMFLLEGRESIEEFISMGWTLEDGSRLFYENVRELLPDAEAKVVFSAIIKAEEEHKDILLGAYRKFRPDALEDALKDEAARGFMESGVSLEDALRWLKSGGRSAQEMLEICLHMEANSLDFYIKVSRKAGDQATKEVLGRLIEEEKTHLKSMGRLMDNLLRPKD